MDFTIMRYKELLGSLKNAGYTFLPYREFLNNNEDKVIVLRHDVDARKLHSLAFARIQNEMGISGTYYFRVVPQSWDEEVIREIAALGHEIGYHYEDIDLAARNSGRPSRELNDEWLAAEAIKLFEQHLEQFRKIARVDTICMHGSPRSPFDNKMVWNYYNYRDYGIIGEPYFDTDFSKVCYITDTGRRWDGHKVSVRDKAPARGNEGDNPFSGLSFHSTADIIEALHKGTFPDRVMMTFHPQRWTDNLLKWSSELLFQNFKNQIKALLILLRENQSKPEA